MNYFFIHIFIYMDDNELQKFCIKFNNLIRKNSKQGDKRISKFVNEEGMLDSIDIISIITHSKITI
jgi:hypothetical protein